MEAQLDYMMVKVAKFSSKLKHSKLSGSDALYATNTQIMKTLAYPLLTISLTKSECTRTMYPALCSLLEKMKVVQTIKQELLYGPRKYQGFGLTNLYALQGCTKLSLLM